MVLELFTLGRSCKIHTASITINIEQRHNIYSILDIIQFISYYRYAVVQTRQIYWANNRTITIAERRKFQ